MKKADGTKNPADVQTKNVPREVCEKHIRVIGCTFREGRASSAAQLHSLRKQHMQLISLFRKLENAKPERPSSVSRIPESITMRKLESLTDAADVKCQASLRVELSDLLAESVKQEMRIREHPRSPGQHL